tara:strand:+ start:1838 stop:2260 length:423 start_codon:yes stop_codon:yes gene_type:complete
MGGSPSIDGGMTEEQYRQLQLDERAFMADQEERQMMLMNEMEDKRTQREQAEMKRQERMRSKEEEALSDLESSITDEVKGLDEAGKSEDKDIVMDFYGSLAKNSADAVAVPGGNENVSEMSGSGKKKTKTSGGKPGGRPK